MKIAGIESRIVRLPFEHGGPPMVFGGQPWTQMECLLVKVWTDDGVVGWGEGFGHVAYQATKAALDQVAAPFFLGRDAGGIEPLLDDALKALHLFGFNGPVVFALSALDIALWDIAGKAAGKPLFEMLGGARRTRVDAYASLMRYADRAVTPRVCQMALHDGYRYIKLHEREPEIIAAAREAVGDEIPLMVDTNCAWTASTAAAAIAEFAHCEPYWVEEPVFPPNDYRGLAEARSTGVPIAAGENTAGLAGFRMLFEHGSVDVAQPSVTKIGGITASRRVFALAQAHGVRVVPHCAYFGPGLIATLHLCVTLPPDTLMERLHLDFTHSLYGAWADAERGAMRVPTGPGLGVEPDAEVIERYTVNGSVVRLEEGKT